MFNTALYYPTIEITNDRWLKSVALFWDRIETIVPQEMEHPYKRRTTKLLEEEGFLFPHRVDPFCEEVVDLTDDLERFCETKAGRMAFMRREAQQNERFNAWDGLSDSRGVDRYQSFFLHASKLPYTARDRFNELIDADGYVKVSEHFMKYYMALLANRICQLNNMSLLTDRVYMNNLSNEALIQGLKRPFGEQEEDDRLGLMYKIVVDNIDLDPATPIDKIIRFKKNRQDELGAFRNEMLRLVSFDTTGMTIADIENEVRSIYINCVTPAVNNLRGALRDARMDWLNAFTSYTLTGVVSSLFAYANPLTIIPIATGSLISITLSSVMYKRKLNQEEARNPYTYLLKMGDVFRQRRH